MKLLIEEALRDYVFYQQEEKVLKFLWKRFKRHFMENDDYLGFWLEIKDAFADKPLNSNIVSLFAMVPRRFPGYQTAPLYLHIIKRVTPEWTNLGIRVSETIEYGISESPEIGAKELERLKYTANQPNYAFLPLKKVWRNSSEADMKTGRTIELLRSFPLQ